MSIVVAVAVLPVGSAAWTALLEMDADKEIRLLLEVAPPVRLLLLLLLLLPEKKNFGRAADDELCVLA